MSIEAINEQLLRAIGVGVALLDLKDLRFRFFNDTFREWFGEIGIGQPISELFPTLDTAAMRAALDGEGRYSTENSFRLRRRTMSVAMTANRALDNGDEIAVLVCQNISRIKELESIIDSYSMMVERNTREIKREKEQVEKLLLNMMPRSVYEEYKTFGVVTPRHYDQVAVLALDFAGFADIVEAQDAGVVVSELNDIYTAFERIGDQFGCERIKTVGDTYITVAGMPDPAENPVSAIANTAMRFVRYLEQRNRSHPLDWKCRIGVSSGSVIGSVVGVQKYIYDVFGPAVIDASRLRQHAAPMGIACNGAVAETLDDTFALTAGGEADLGDGPVPIFALTSTMDAGSRA